MELIVEGGFVEMPKYRCHKEVHALKIKEIQIGHTRAVIVPEDPRYGPIVVDMLFIDKHEPKAGGYYVVYSNGHKSDSPADAFEAGYTKI
jgi:hypothetical protein